MIKAKYCYIDFEYTGSKEKELNLICCSLSYENTTETYWLQGISNDKNILTEKLHALNAMNTVFVAYQVVAEARCFLTLGIDPVKCKWVDLHLEDKMLTNSNNKFGYGLQLVDGKIIKTHNYTKYDDDYSQDLNCSKPQRNYGACCFRFLNKKIDSIEKNEVRDLIITKRENFSVNEMKRIMLYCESDIEHLPNILEVVFKYYADRKMINQESAMLERAEYSALTAIMESKGYPVHSEYLESFMSKTFIIINECMKDVTKNCNAIYGNDRFQPFEKKANIYKMITNLDEFYLGMPVEEVKTLLGEKAESRSGKRALGSYEKYLVTDNYKMNMSNIRRWISTHSGIRNWDTTKTGALSLAKDSWQKYYSFTHDYPEDNYAAQIVRFLKLKESMNGFLPNSKKPITNNLGTDGRIRPYMNIYGAQSSRSQPSASSFIFLKAAWSRVLVHPNPNKVLVGIDYGSQEVLVQGVLSALHQKLQTTPLIESYASGDVYLDFAKRAGAVPKDGTKEEYKKERDMFKSTFLGIGYGMQARSLARKLTSDTGQTVNEYQAEELINDFYSIYHVYKEYLEQIESDYEDNEKLQLLDHWTLFGDNTNPRSVKNFMIQGNSAVVMRRAVKLCYERKIEVVFTLHDALYAEFDVDKDLKSNIELFDMTMRQAFTDIFNHRKSELIRTDVTAWGDYFTDNTLDAGYEEKNLYLDERAKKDYKFFSKFFIDKTYNMKGETNGV